MAYPTFGGSSAALKGCATKKAVISGVLGKPPRRPQCLALRLGLKPVGRPGNIRRIDRVIGRKTRKLEP
jgi:hypothetical protein